MSTSDALFFDYACDHCGSPLCERVQIMNLALGYEEELFCLPCLAAEQENTEAGIASFARDYIYSRDCFKTPWLRFAASAAQCPRLSLHQCLCQDNP